MELELGLAQKLARKMARQLELGLAQKLARKMARQLELGLWMWLELQLPEDQVSRRAIHRLKDKCQFLGYPYDKHSLILILHQ